VPSICTDCPDCALASLPARVDVCPSTTTFGVSVRGPDVGNDMTVTVPRKLFDLCAGSEKLNSPALENVQFALCPAAIARGSAALQCGPVVVLNRFATVSSSETATMRNKRSLRIRTSLRIGWPATERTGLLYPPAFLRESELGLTDLVVTRQCCAGPAKYCVKVRGKHLSLARPTNGNRIGFCI
jgi:hypothetical protein